MWPTRAVGTSSSTASSMPRPARSTGTTTTSPRDAAARPPDRAASRPWPSIARHVAHRLGRQQQADAHRHAAEQLRRRRRVAQRRERVVHQRVLDEVERHAAHYTKVGQQAKGKRRSEVADTDSAPSACCCISAPCCSAAPSSRRVILRKRSAQTVSLDRHRRHRRDDGSPARDPVARRGRHRRQRHRRRRYARGDRRAGSRGRRRSTPPARS